MFGKKDIDDEVVHRLKAIKDARPVQFSQLQKEALAEARQADREDDRKPVYKFGVIVMRGGEEARCVVRDISEHGARIVLEGSIPLPREFRLVIDGYRAPTTASLAWQKENEAGVSFG